MWTSFQAAAIRISSLALFGLISLSGCAALDALNPFSADPPSAPSVPDLAAAAPKIVYAPEIVVSGEDSGRVLRPLFEDASRLIRLQDRPPTSLERLRRRAEGDIERFVRIMRSEGFYKGRAKFSLETTTTPVRAVTTIDPGPPFKLDRYTIDYDVALAAAPPSFPSSAEDVGLELGSRGRADDILKAKAAVTSKLANAGRPLARVIDHEVHADFATDTMAVKLVVDPGPPAVFGEMAVTGLEDVERKLIENLVPWDPGEIYRQKKVEAFERELVRTRLFSSVAARHDEAAQADGRLPISLRVEEDKHRSVGAGASYSTNTGLGVNAYWEHRNLLGQGERLRANIKLSEIQQVAGLTTSKPAFLRHDQTLVGEVRLERNRTEAFDQDLLASSVGLERTFEERFSGRAGLSAEYSTITDTFGEKTVLLFGLPLRLMYDSSDELLNPTEGWRITLAATPFAGNDGESMLSFLRNSLSASTYISLDDEQRYVFAARGEIGSIVGESRRRIPANHRFYSGGGGSVRGYGFQLIGPLDDKDEPLGGRSTAELGLEMRIRIGERYGIVPFVEAGTVDDGALPRLGGEIQWAAGIGGRYYTNFGPIRLDLAFPLNPRDADDSFQFLISLGQSF